MLLLLFNGQVAAPASGDVVTSMLIETAPGTWYDATADLVSGTVTRGRNNELDRYQAGTAEVVLSNDDRKYDPAYAASPLYPYVLPMKRVQLKNTYGGVTYPMFTGYADRWTQDRPGPHRGTTSLQATDGLKVLERARLLSSAYAQEALADGPLHWWRLGDPAGSTAANDSGSSPIAGAYAGTVTLGTAGLISRDPDTAVTFPAAGAGTMTAPAALPAGAVVTVEAVVKVTALPAGTSRLITNTSGGGGAPDFTVASSAGQLILGFNAGGVAGSHPTLFAVNATVHIAGTVDATGKLRVYLNGVADETASGVAVAWPADGVKAGTTVGETCAAVIDEVAVYSTALSSARIAAHAAAVTTPWNGDLSGARVTRVLDAVGWPAADRSIDAGQTTLQSAALDMTALEHLQKVADTEFGNLYVTAGGTVRFEDRNSGVDQPVLFAFSDAAGAGLAITFSNPEMADTDIRNDVTVSRLEGAAQTARDATSIATYQTSSYVRDGLYNNSDAHSRYLADFILQGYKDPAERVPTMAVNPYRDPANLWPAILALELTDRVTLTETPQWVTPAVARTAVVEGISHTFSAKAWSASFNLSQNTTATQAYWQLGVAGYSELGETTRLFF